jgi:RNA 2',3'-cyclic 3'-phosphodiesterase
MRLFIAATLPLDVAEALDHVIRSVKPRVGAASWVRPEAQHVTFAFVGEQPERAIDTISATLAPRLAPVAALEARLEGAGFFPSRSRPRIAWCSVTPRDPLMAIATVVRERLAVAGIPFDEKPFHPHLTLARLKGSWAAESVATFESAIGAFDSPLFHIDHVLLYGSRLSTEGATHTLLASYPLARSSRPPYTDEPS